MKPLRARLEEARNRVGLPWEVLERDYLLSWVLAGISRVPDLHEALVFKGGTALRKCYFGDYRFSEDLDFSGRPGCPTGATLERAIRQACILASELLEEYAEVELSCERYTEKEPHPGGQEAFAVRARFPWHRRLHTRVIIEIAMDEEILAEPFRRAILHAYGEPLEAELLVYSPMEIVAEKLRAILQYIERLEARGWSRSRARDYYDLWRLLAAHRSLLDRPDFVDFLRRKCGVRGVTFASPDDFFQPSMMAYVERTWVQWLGPLVPELPAFEVAIGELRPQVAALLSGGR